MMVFICNILQRDLPSVMMVMLLLRLTVNILALHHLQNETFWREISNFPHFQVSFNCQKSFEFPFFVCFTGPNIFNDANVIVCVKLLKWPFILFRSRFICLFVCESVCVCMYDLFMYYVIYMLL